MYTDHCNTLHNMVGEEEIEHDRNRQKRLKMVIQAFPVWLIKLASTFNEEANANENVKDWQLHIERGLKLVIPIKGYHRRDAINISSSSE